MWKQHLNGQSSLRIPLILRPSVLPASQSVVLSVDWKLLVWYSVSVRHVAAEHANNDVCDFDWCLTMFCGHWVVDNASKLWRISSLAVGRLFFYCAWDFRRRRAVGSLRSDRFWLLTTSPLWSSWSRWHSSWGPFHNRPTSDERIVGNRLLNNRIPNVIGSYDYRRRKVIVTK